MCQVNETPPKSKDYIGYAVVVKAFDEPDTGKVYDAVFYPQLPYFGYTIGTKYEASTQHTFQSNYYLGFHGFHSVADAQEFLDSLFTPRCRYSGKLMCIVEAKFEEVIAEGDYIDAPLKLRSFRAKYRTILREVSNDVERIFR